MCCLIGVVQLAPPVADACELSNSQAKQIGFVQLLPPVAGVCDLSNSHKDAYLIVCLLRSGWLQWSDVVLLQVVVCCGM
jgi:hypothetical protein